MDRIEIYRDIIKRVMRELVKYIPDEEGIRTELLLDDGNGHYQVMQIGWKDRRRIHGTLFHVDLIGDKVHVEHDGTDLALVDDLLDAGIPKHDIVIGFHPPAHRKYTDFAVS
jgi:ketopantoate reductase